MKTIKLLFNYSMYLFYMKKHERTYKKRKELVTTMTKQEFQSTYAKNKMIYEECTSFLNKAKSYLLRCQ